MIKGSKYLMFDQLLCIIHDLEFLKEFLSVTSVDILNSFKTSVGREVMREC